MANKNGDGIVYNCSDCGKDYVRFYGFGGDGPGSICGTWELTPTQIKEPNYNNSYSLKT